MSELLSLHNLSIDYKVKGGQLSAVNNVNLSIGTGEILAIVGESGCGKSTIAHSIMKLLPGSNSQVTGEIMFNGTDLNALSKKEMQKIRGKEIGMIFQNPLDSLNPVYKTGRQVSEAILLDGVNKEDAWLKAIELYKSVRMPEAEKRVHSFPHELSGGMRQRVMIAMMLSRNPKLLICDEPTTALDVTIEAQILEILKDLRDTYNTSIMLITHNFGLVAEIADRIAVMYAGEVVESGDVYDIFRNPQHPYTKLLMQALPRGTKSDGKLQTIDGTVPRILNHKEGCRFANRCPYAMDKCVSSNPPEVNCGKDHTCRCFMVHESEDGK